MPPEIAVPIDIRPLFRVFIAEPVTGLAEQVLGRHPHVLEVHALEVVRLQPQGLEARTGRETLHALLDDERDVPEVGAGEHRQHVLVAVADPALLAVQQPRAVGLPLCPGLEVVGVRSHVRLGQHERGQLAPGGEVGQPARLLVVGAVQVERLRADRLVHAHHDGESAVDVAELLHDPAVARLTEAQAAVLLVDEHAGQLALAEVADDVVADPALLLRLPRVEGAEVVPGARDRGIHLRAHVAGDDRVGHDELRLGLTEEQPLGETGLGGAVDGGRALGVGGCGGSLRGHAPIVGLGRSTRQCVVAKLQPDRRGIPCRL
jgi:hypothetical protein